MCAQLSCFARNHAVSTRMWVLLCFFGTVAHRSQAFAVVCKSQHLADGVASFRSCSNAICFVQVSFSFGTTFETILATPVESYCVDLALSLYAVVRCSDKRRSRLTPIRLHAKKTPTSALLPSVSSDQHTWLYAPRGIPSLNE